MSDSDKVPPSGNAALRPAGGAPSSAAKGSAVIVFICSGFALAAISAFYFRIMSAGWELFAVPQFFLLLTLITPVFLWQTLALPSTARRISIISSTLIWCLGMLAAFVFRPPSPFISTSDGLMLLGFFPLLYLWRFSLPWIFFGFFNGAIGIFLLLLTLLSDSYFPSALWPPKHHLAEFHPYMTWLLFGAASILFGLIRLMKNMFLLAARWPLKKESGAK